jgi:hypothetical protein
VTAPGRARPFPFFNLLLTLFFWLALAVFFYSGRLMRPVQLVSGQQAPETVFAAVDFSAENMAATQQKQRLAQDSVLPVFTVDMTAIENARNVLTTNQLTQLIPGDGQTDMQAVIFTAISNAVSRGIISASDKQTRFNGAAPQGKVTLRGPKTDTIRMIDSFLQQPDALKEAVEEVLRKLPREKRSEETVRALIAQWLWPNLVYDAQETETRRQQEVKLVNPVFETVSSETVLLRKGATVNEQALLWLAAHEKRLSELETEAERIQRLAGSGLLLLLGLAMIAAVAGIIEPALLRNRRQVLLLATLSVLPLVIGKGMLYATVNLHVLPSSVIQFAMPLAIAPMLASILIGGAAGLIVGLWVSFALATLLGGSYEVFLLGIMVSCAAVYTTRDVKRRAALFRAGFWIGTVEVLVVLVLAILGKPAWTTLLPQLGISMFFGLGSALLAMLLIPVFEHLFNVTTDISLLELSDLSHPLLQSLAINAPGTYHHSLMMASLAQNAAEAVGANGLMLRVCAYFHDIGKLVKPGFFSENIQFSENPHDELTPSMSTLVIVSHIKEGVTLAKKYKLPQVIIDGIEQHQGTSLVSVFYHRAKTQQKEAVSGQPAINDEDFRYDGPRPQTREMAILMLADGCEAASRSIDKPTPARIANLISEIFDSRLRDGQLDECNLTLADLNKIKKAFIFSLTNMLHGRIAYPRMDEPEAEKPEEKETNNSELPPEMK